MEAEPRPDPVAALRAALEAVAAGLDGAAVERATLERPPKPELGDYSTNAAMLLAPSVGAAPREIAERLREPLAERLGSSAERIEVAGPGFLNLFLSDRWHRDATVDLLGAPPRRLGARERVLVEFVSANPTGPVTVASGRGAAYGDSLARLFAYSGHPVTREYYLNDAGSQVRLFALSIAARMRGSEPPADGYAGLYIAELAEQLAARGADPDDLDALGAQAIEAMKGRIESTLERFGVRYDAWFSERSLFETGPFERTLAELRERGHVYDSEGAVWLRTTAFGDDKDRVLIRSDGEPTYFAADIAYHRDKLGRADLMLTPLGADHHGYVPRMRAAIAALGASPDRYEAPIMQLVGVVDGGERARMSKRRGEFVTLDELIDDIGADAARWFLAQRSHDTAVDLDLGLARSASQDNPVYYVQYAHARIASILRKAIDDGAVAGVEAIEAAAGSERAIEAPAEPAERALVRRLLELPAEAATAAERRAPHRLCAFAMATAADFHVFYRDCRVVGAEPDTQAARLGLCVATKHTLATTLGLLGVSSPERM